MPIKRTYNYTSISGALSISVKPDTLYSCGAVYLREARVHAYRKMHTGVFRVDLDSTTGAAYDVNLVTQNVTDVQDYAILFGSPGVLVNSGDALNCTCTSANEDNTYGLTLIWEEFLK